MDWDEPVAQCSRQQQLILQGKAVCGADSHFRCTGKTVCFAVRMWLVIPGHGVAQCMPIIGMMPIIRFTSGPARSVMIAAGCRVRACAAHGRRQDLQ